MSTAVVGASILSVLPPLAGTAQSAPSSCAISSSSAEADNLMANRYHFGAHPVVTLPADLAWSEDPLHDRNWRFDFHALRWVEALYLKWQQTNDSRYLDRYTELLQDWYDDNPVAHPPSDFSWNDHAAAWRGMEYACALGRFEKMET